jgi:hypothetical protein
MADTTSLYCPFAANLSKTLAVLGFGHLVTLSLAAGAKARIPRPVKTCHGALAILGLLIPPSLQQGSSESSAARQPFTSV